MKNFIEKIKKNYRDSFKQSNKPPKSIAEFMKDLGKDEQDFFKYYNSFFELDKDIWSDVAITTINKVKGEEVYQNYSVREKMLSFLFTLSEVMKDDQSFVRYQFKNKKNERFGLTPRFLDDFKKEFMSFSHEIVNEGL
ncbi:MAG: TetR/AcrR family transcriptional regulator, partial [Bacteroidota bacterium]